MILVGQEPTTILAPNFSGEIPTILKILKLSYMDVSFNQFFGDHESMILI
jgi:hypothetical protein